MAADAPCLMVGHAQVVELLPMEECIELMASVLRALQKGEAAMPLRFGYKLPLPDAKFGVLASMPSYLALPSGEAFCANKVITVFPQNKAVGKHSHQGAIMLFEAAHGKLVAIVDAGEVTAVRTAAASGVATRLLAREGAACAELALLGAGVQARTHLQAMLLVRPSLRRVCVWSRTAASAERFCAWARETFPALEEVRAVDSAEAAARGADIICTLTPSLEPVLLSAWVKDGAHINAVGACTPRHCELEGALVARCRLFADQRVSCLAEPGDVVQAISAGLITAAHVQAELGELLCADGAGGASRGRQAEADVTVFESLGLAVEDLAAALHIYRQLVQQRDGADGDAAAATAALAPALQMELNPPSN